MPQPETNSIPATLIPGDRIGPEIVDATLATLQALGAPFVMATRLRSAIDATLNLDQVRTGDLGGKAGTAEFTRAPVARIENG